MTPAATRPIPCHTEARKRHVPSSPTRRPPAASSGRGVPQPGRGTSRAAAFAAAFAVALTVALTVGLVGCDDVKREAELRAAEATGEIASRVMARRSAGDGGDEVHHSRDFDQIPVEVRKIAENVYQARGIGNTQVVATSEGHVVFDTGLATQAAKQRRLLREALPDAPISHVILSHSHQDHVGGTRFWVEDGSEIVTHYDYPEEQRYLKALEDYLWFRNRTLFPFMPEEPPKSGMFAHGDVVPTRLVQDPEPYRFEQGGIRFEVWPTPGAEGADNLSLWLPDQEIFFSGDFFGPNFPQFPNVFTMRGEKVRKPIEYIASLDTVIALGPAMIVPSHQDPIEGKERIRADLVRMRDAVQYVHDAVVAGMNAGRSVHELMAEIELPQELALSQVHGRVSWAVKSIWEYYATWFHFDRTTELYAVPRSAIEPELAALAGVDALVARAGAHVEADRPLEALHLLEVALAGDPGHPEALSVRRAALSNLLEEALATHQNSYEIDWLSYRLRTTDEALAAVR